MIMMIKLYFQIPDGLRKSLTKKKLESNLDTYKTKS